MSSSSISNLRATRTMEMDRVTAYRHEEKEKWHKIVIKVSPFRLFENKKKRRVFLFSRVRDGSSLRDGSYLPIQLVKTLCVENRWALLCFLTLMSFTTQQRQQQT